jgi:hypothetical protein
MMRQPRPASFAIVSFDQDFAKVANALGGIKVRAP